MHCNACDSELETVIEDLNLLGCQKCGLLWFTQGQFERINLVKEPLLEEFADIEDCKTIEKGERCNKCDIPLHFHKFPINPNVLYAECYNCSGAYITAAQLKDIREHSMNEEQLEAYRNSLAHSVEGFTQAEDIRHSRQGHGKLASLWRKCRFWSKEDE